MQRNENGSFKIGPGRALGSKNRRSIDDLARRALGNVLDEDGLTDALETLKQNDPAKFAEVVLEYCGSGAATPCGPLAGELVC